MLTRQDKEKFMQEALFEARTAERLGEVPIGAVIVQNGKIIARAHNLREHRQDATTHAEMLAIQMACFALHNWRLEQTQLFVTLEPCPMCAGAILNARIPEVYYGAPDPKAGATGTLLNLLDDSRFNHQSVIEGGVLEAECGQILTDFFRKLRLKKKINKQLRQQNKKSGE